MTNPGEDSPTQSLLPHHHEHHRHRPRPVGSIGSRYSTAQRFCGFAAFGTLFLVAFSLVFAPRTSVSRDLRRLHHKIPQAELEKALFASIDPQNIRAYSEKYTSSPHLGGTNYELAKWTADTFEEFGIKAEIPSYDCYINYPLSSGIELYNKHDEVSYVPSLKEDILEEDPTTGLVDQVPVFHGYSYSGEAKGKFIYANYGRKEDFDLLVSKGVDFSDKIVIVKYGKNFRGLKVKLAQELGAAAVLMYSDPADDGGITLKNGYKAYPDGPARNPSSVQRGSVQFLSVTPGDPTTPGWASKKGAERVSPYERIPSIPSLPISYREVIPILEQLNGHGLKPEELGEDWKGELEEFDYSVGPSEVELKLSNLQNYTITPLYNVIGRIQGIRSHEVVVIGNHRDAWIAGGAGDPNSGSAVLLELAKAFGEMIKSGWKPLRTIVLASWDGEEYGLLGSTEWAEDHAKFLGDNVVAYINCDVAVSGHHLSVGASPLLNQLIREATKKVNHPLGGTVYEKWFKQNGATIKNLGSGSDYTVFQDHLGIPSINFGYTFGPGDPVYHYHSIYDSFHWMDKYDDPHWTYHSAMAKVWGLLTLGISENEIIPFETEEYGHLLKVYVEDLEKKFPVLGAIKQALDVNYDEKFGFKNLDQSQEIFNIQRTSKPYNKLIQSIGKFIKSAAEFDDYIAMLHKEFIKDYPWYKYPKKFRIIVAIKIANAKLFILERAFLHDEGLDGGRSWFKHVVFAPGRYTGYAGALLPGLLEALEDKDWNGIEKWLTIITDCVDNANKIIS